MNPGGEPERDDTGLPPVDIEIPDDARDLDRDVQAYYRELRAERRAQRRRRLSKTLARDGIVLPLLACCLILALVTGTLLTVFTATSDQSQKNLPGYGRSPDTGRSNAGSAATRSGRSGAAAQPGSQEPAGASSSPSSAATGKASASAAATTGSSAAALPATVLHTTLARLPDGTLTVASGGQLPLRVLSGAMLVLIPPACRCAATVQALATLATDDRAPAFLVETPGNAVEVQRLGARLPRPASAAISLAAYQGPALDSVAPVAGLTVLIVGSDGSLSWANKLTASLPAGPVQYALARCPTC